MPELTPDEKMDLMRRHIQLWSATWGAGERNVDTLKKFAKVYLQGFDGAADKRQMIYEAETIDQLLQL